MSDTMKFQEWVIENQIRYKIIIIENQFGFIHRNLLGRYLFFEAINEKI